jgi:uncharacterized membrane protein
MVVYVCATLLSIMFAAFSSKQIGARPIQYSDSKYIKNYHEDSLNNFYVFVFALLSFLPLFFVSAFRYGISFDYNYTYVPYYNRIANGYSAYYEPGFVLLNQFVNAVFHNVDWLFIITSFIFLLFSYLAIYQQSSDIAFSIFLLVCSRMYFFSFGQIREYIVIAIFLYSLKFIEKRKPISYFILICLAVTIHKTALAYLLIYFFVNRRISRRAYIVVAAMAPLLGFALTPIYSFFANRYYPNYVMLGYGLDNNSIAMILYTLIVLILSIIFYYRMESNEKNTVLLNLQLICWIICVTTQGVWESYRLVALFLYSSILLIPEIILAQQSKTSRVLIKLFFIIMPIVYVIPFITNGNYFIPYRSIFNK